MELLIPHGLRLPAFGTIIEAVSPEGHHMPEGDTLMWTARRLNGALLNAVVTRSDLRVPALATTDLSGRTVLPVVTYGKHLFHRFSGGMTLHSHLKMEGRWSVVRAPHTAKPASPQARRLSAEVRSLERGHTTRALLYTPDALAAGTSLGVLELVATEDEERLTAHLGPDILAEDWPTSGRDEAMRRLLAQGERDLGEALLDQRNLAGLGTFWISEMLYVHHVLPWTAVEDVDAHVLDTVLTDARERMLLSGTTGVQTSTGRTVTGETKYVHARSGLPCHRCHDTVRVAMTGPAGKERTLFSCPTCQGGFAPHDDRAPQRPLVERPRR